MNRWIDGWMDGWMDGRMDENLIPHQTYLSHGNQSQGKLDSMMERWMDGWIVGR